jgi:hypothetical protein
VSNFIFRNTCHTLPQHPISLLKLSNSKERMKEFTVCKKKVKLSCYMPWRHMGGEEV